MLDIDYFPEDQFLLAGWMSESSVCQPFWNQRVVYHYGGRQATILDPCIGLVLVFFIIFFNISCILLRGHWQWEKLCSHCYDQRVECFVAIMSPFIFLCVMNQPWTTNHRLHKTAVWQILPIIVDFFFCLGKADVLLICNGTALLFLIYTSRCNVHVWKEASALHILRGRSPSAEAFWSQREGSRAEGQEGSKSDSPRSKGPGPERHRPLPELPQNTQMVLEPCFLLQRSLVASCCWDEKEIGFLSTSRKFHYTRTLIVAL